MNPGNITGIALGVDLINGRIKPNNKHRKLKIFISIFLLVAFAFLFILGLFSLDLELILFSLCLLLSFGYLFMISPYFQNSKNYYIEFINKNQLKDFKLYYKNKLVKINYVVGNDGKIAFANNMSKLDCISYDDNHKMSNFTKYRIINYFSRWLMDNNLISEEVTVTFEKL